MKLTPQKIDTICKGDQEIAGYFHMLLNVIDQQAEKIEKLEKRVHDLERQLGQNSNNSSKPPSSDGFRKPTNLRKPGGKKGAPKGHQGHTLHRVDTPDILITHAVTSCSRCSASLILEPCAGYENRQVFDLPKPCLVVTEHRAEKKCCPYCRSLQQASFPDGVNAPVQYGDSLTAWAVYLIAYQMLPLE
jgi:transposase